MTGTHETYWWEAPTSASHVAPAPASRGQVPRTLALPPGWPTGKVLTDGPSSGNRPSLESRPFWFSRASAPPRPALFTPAPHRERPLPAQGLISTPVPDLSFLKCALSIVKWVPRRTPRVPARPPSADPSGTAQSWVGRTVQALRTLDRDFRGPACDGLGTGM